MGYGGRGVAARIRRAAGVGLLAAILPLSGCDDTDGIDAEDRAAAIKAARSYEQAQVDRDWEAACEAGTKRLLHSLGADTVAECIEIYDVPPLRTYSDVRVSIGEVIEIPSFGRHPAGIGLRATVERGQPDPHSSHTALRLVPGDEGTWLVDQAAHLIAVEDSDTEGTDAERRMIAERTDMEAVRAALERK
ncbi:hypothetical protein GCM10023257_24500 [Streptomyces hyderabadensis]|uniref:Lipoprotein n=1 Tax=Streptomyces hyderabadensis TaxID=598549 RepID=A0ABP9I0U3_9ACTN